MSIYFSLVPSRLVSSFFSLGELWTQKKKKSTSLFLTAKYVVQRLFTESLLCGRPVSSLSLPSAPPGCPSPFVHRRVRVEMHGLQVRASVRGESLSHPTSIRVAGLNKIPLFIKDIHG